MADYPAALPSSAPVDHQQVNDNVVAVAVELDAHKAAINSHPDYIDQTELNAAIAQEVADRDAAIAAGSPGAENPWTLYTPTIQNMTKGNGTASGSYKEIGYTVLFRAKFIFGSTSSIAGTGVVAGGPWIGLPVEPMYYADSVMVPAVLLDFSAGLRYLWGGLLVDTGSGLMAVCHSSTGAVITATVPYTWAAGDSISVSGVYEKNSLLPG